MHLIHWLFFVAKPPKYMKFNFFTPGDSNSHVLVLFLYGWHRNLVFYIYPVISCSELLLKPWVYQRKKLRPVKKINLWQLRNGLVWEKNIWSPLATPGVKVCANQRQVFCYITIELYIVSLINTHIWPHECTWHT